MTKMSFGGGVFEKGMWGVYNSQIGKNGGFFDTVKKHTKLLIKFKTCHVICFFVSFLFGVDTRKKSVMTLGIHSAKVEDREFLLFE